MALRTEPNGGRLAAVLATTLLLGTATALPAGAQVGDTRPAAVSPTAKVARAASPFSLSIDRSEYALAGQSMPRPLPAGRIAPQAAGRTTPHGASHFSPLIERQARASGVDPRLVHAVIRAESAYRPDAVSPKGAIGLMQLMPATARRFGVVDAGHPESNVGAGSAYLRLLLDRFNSLPLALAAYNAGEAAVVRHGNRIPPYAETVGYVQRILRDYGSESERASPPSPVYAPGLRLAGSDSEAYRLILTPRR